MRYHKYPGRIFYEFWVRCGTCGYEYPSTRTTHGKTAQEARSFGWKQRGEPYGWICRDCAAELAKATDKP